MTATAEELLDALLDALERLVTNHPRASCAVGVPPDAIAQLRAAIRTHEETEALRAALEWLSAWVHKDEEVGIVDAEEKLVAALDDLPDDVKARLRGGND